jgi:hypothetical protein
MPNHKIGIKSLFLAVILWQLPQIAITARFGEPYPALTMPSFAGTLADQNGNIRLRDVKCQIWFRDGSVRWTSPHGLLSQVPDSTRAPIMAHMFSPVPAGVEPPPPNTLKARLFPGKALSKLRGKQKELDFETKKWLLERIAVLYPAAKPVAISFVWYDDVFNVNRTAAAPTREPVGIREVRFE